MVHGITLFKLGNIVSLVNKKNEHDKTDAVSRRKSKFEVSNSSKLTNMIKLML